MKLSTKIGIYVGCILCILSLFMWFGSRLYQLTHKCPEITHDTITIVDTITKLIPNDIHHYHTHLDTIIYRDTIFKDVDTAQILKDYFALYKYNRHWEDSLISVNLYDEVSKNSFIDSRFSYKILRPQTIINNVVHTPDIIYNRYLMGGIGVDTKNFANISLDAQYIWEKGYVGYSYTPNTKTHGIKAGVKLLKLKKN